ncbi:hypothetical protein PWT90_10200 [Aphanocladium album]|nr:hypothetical protein PWT90_10200 [Aphanocladium album]
MKFLSTTLALSVLAPLALARNCTPGFYYCGHTLLEIGNYHNQITNALVEADKGTNYNWVNFSLFWCTGAPNGDIDFAQSCNGPCTNAGNGKNDHCG